MTLEVAKEDIWVRERPSALKPVIELENSLRLRQNFMMRRMLIARDLPRRL